MKYKLVLISLLFFQNLLSQTNISNLELFVDAGLVYGVRQQNIGGNGYRLRHHPSFQSSVGTRISSKKERSFFQLQVGYTTAVSSMSYSGAPIKLISVNTSSSLDGPLNSTSHMFSIKMGYLHKLKQWQLEKTNVKLLAGVGLQYVFTFDGNEYGFEGRTAATSEYYLLLSLDRKKIQGVTTSNKVVTRMPGLQSIVAVQMSRDKWPFALELYWSPSFTPSIQYAYTMGINYAIGATGNASQMQNGFGIKFLYRPKVYKR